MLFAILILFILPIVNTSEIRSTTFRPLFKIFLWLLIGDFIFLGWIGQKPVRDTFIFAGQIATAYYFIFFTVLVPIIGIVEKKLIRYPANIPKVLNSVVFNLTISPRITKNPTLKKLTRIILLMSLLYVIMSRFKLAVNYYSEFPEVFQFIAFLELLEVVTIFLCIILFFILFWGNSINSLIYKHFKKLSFKNKIFFAWFTIVFAIPNKIIINNKAPNFLTSLIVFLIIVISSIFPIFILFYIIFCLNAMESYFFAMFYEERESFKKFMDSKLFENNLTFSKDYFNFFWGNMRSAGGSKSLSGLYGTVLGLCYKTARDHEKTQLRERTERSVERYLANSQKKFETPQEAFEFEKNVENHITDRDLTFLKGEKYAIEKGTILANMIKNIYNL
jgi:hypothetical protein